MTKSRPMHTKDLPKYSHLGSSSSSIICKAALWSAEERAVCDRLACSRHQPGPECIEAAESQGSRSERQEPCKPLVCQCTNLFRMPLVITTAKTASIDNNILLSAAELELLSVPCANPSNPDALSYCKMTTASLCCVFNHIR